MSVRAVIQKVREEGIDHPLAPSTVHRLFSREGLFDKKPPDGEDRRRFAFQNAGELWMSDVMHGPKVRDGRTLEVADMSGAAESRRTAGEIDMTSLDGMSW